VDVMYSKNRVFLTHSNVFTIDFCLEERRTFFEMRMQMYEPFDTSQHFEKKI